MAIYEELLFNNLTGFPSTPAFPWVGRCWAKYAGGDSTGPSFGIGAVQPPGFAKFLGSSFAISRKGRSVSRYRPGSPNWLTTSGAELTIDISDAPIPAHDPEGDLIANRAVPQPGAPEPRLRLAGQSHRPAYRPRKAPGHLSPGLSRCDRRWLSPPAIR